jgi:hemoglobin-like flavoprotein
MITMAKTLTPRQIQLVQRTWKIFQQIDPNLVGAIFYGKLFSEHPALRKMFPRHMEQQHKKLVDMMSLIVTHIERPLFIAEAMRSSGKRHGEYGVKPVYYDYVGEAFLWMLEKGLGNDWNEEVKDAWTACYLHAVDMMTAQEPG